MRGRSRATRRFMPAAWSPTACCPWLWTSPRKTDCNCGGEQRGRLVTSTLRLSGSITVNANVGGELRVRVLDEGGTPLAGFDFSDGSVIRGDSLAHPLRWKSDLATLKDKPVRLEFVLDDTALYGFELTR